MEGNRKTIRINDIEESAGVRFLYENPLGRIILKLLTLPFVSAIVGRFMETRASSLLIKRFIEKNKINMYEYGRSPYKTFNDFFSRQMRQGVRPYAMEKDALIAPCDGKLTAYKVDRTSFFNIKGVNYSLEDLVKDGDTARNFAGGTCLIFRLTVDDYHRYIYLDNGKKDDNFFIKGKLHTVRPIAFRDHNVYRENSREYTVMETENFGRVLQMEVGAMMVGKIRNYQRVCSFSKGQEKGMFKFGGSTVILLLEERGAEIDEEFFKNTAAGLETVVRIGERIGTAINR